MKHPSTMDIDMKSEYSSLVDLVLSSGVVYSDLIAEIHANILDAYKGRYPKAPIDSTVFVDEKTGEVRLLSGDKNITPVDFAAEAGRIARMTLIKHLEIPSSALNTDLKPPEEAPIETYTKSKPKGTPTIAKFLSIVLFWGYNGMYLVFLAVFIFGFLSSDLRESLFNLLKQLGSIRSFLFLLLLGIPLATIVYALREKLSQTPEKLGKLFFLLEVPLLVLIYFPLSLPLNLTPIMWFFTLLLLFIPPALYFYDEIREVSSKTKLTVFMSIQQLLAMASVYLTLLFAFFAPLILGGIASELFRGFFSSVVTKQGGMDIMYTPSFGDLIGKLVVFALGTFALLVVSGIILIPFLITYIFIKNFLLTRRQLFQFYAKTQVTNLNITFGIVVLFVTIGLSFQPSTNHLLQKLESLNKAVTFSERESLAREIIPQEQNLKEAILDISNSSRRFLFTKDDTTLKEGYNEVFELDETLSDFVQKTFLTLAYPFVYQGPTNNSYELIHQFAYVFGYSPYESQMSKPQAQQNVRIVNRTLKATTDDKNPLATVVFEETYENKTFANQEVVYEFSLPNEAVVTDLKLGPNLEFPGIIAPKGAARQVYEQELNRRRDPALLEQTGPRQYRLRVFPIPPKNDTSMGPFNNFQKVQFTYAAGLTPEGIPLPVFSKEQNSVIEKNSQLVAVVDNHNLRLDNGQLFLKPAQGIDFSTVSACGNAITRETQIGSEIINIIYHSSNPQFAAICNDPLSPVTTLSGLKIALLYDVSYENKNNDDKGNDTLTQLKKLQNSAGLLDRNSVDLYLYNGILSEARPLTTESLNRLQFTYFGKSDVYQALNNLSGNYDAVVIVNGKNIPIDKRISFSNKSPIYLIHPNNQYPRYPQNLTAAIIQSKGSVENSVAEAFVHLSLSKAITTDPTFIYIGPFWSLKRQSILAQPTIVTKSDNIVIPTTDPLFSIAGHALAYSAIANLTTDPETDTQFLDNLHQFAKNARIVTPYSSLIALVNEVQIQNLEEASKNYNRYEEAQVIQPDFGSVSRPLNIPSISIMDSIVGAPMMLEKSAPQGFSGGGIMGGGITAPAYHSSPLSFFGNGSIVFLFIIITVVIFIAGFTIYLLGMVRKKK